MPQTTLDDTESQGQEVSVKVLFEEFLVEVPNLEVGSEPASSKVADALVQHIARGGGVRDGGGQRQGDPQGAGHLAGKMFDG